MDMLSKKTQNSLDSIISLIIQSKEYQACIQLKEQMNSNPEICTLISKVKILQKKYIRSQQDASIKEQLDTAIKRLNQIPIYSIYNQNLEIVNSMISFVNDEINDYFYKKLNESVKF